MIISSLLNVVLSLITTLLNFLPSLPALSSDFTNVWQQFLDIVYNGMSLVGNWIFLPLALNCLLLRVSVELFFEAYNFIAWFVNKIPFINIKM